MELVKMQKGEIIADVHPDMVEEYRKGDYVIIENSKAEALKETVEAKPAKKKKWGGK